MNQPIPHSDERRTLEVIHAFTTAPCDMRTTGRTVRISDDLFDTKVFESWILRVQPDPRRTIEGLAGMNVSAREIVMKVPSQVIPAAIIDRGHQSTQQLNSNHAVRLLAPADTHRFVQRGRLRAERDFRHVS